MARIAECLGEKLIIKPLLGCKQRLLYVDDASSYNNTTQALSALQESQTKLFFLPKMRQIFASHPTPSLLKRSKQFNEECETKTSLYD